MLHKRFILELIIKFCIEFRMEKRIEFQRYSDYSALPMMGKTFLEVCTCYRLPTLSLTQAEAELICFSCYGEAIVAGLSTKRAVLRQRFVR